MIVGRRVDPMTSVCIEEINGEPALGSPYRDVLCAAGFRAGYRGLTLYGS
jgi:hypothetical protein